MLTIILLTAALLSAACSAETPLPDVPLSERSAGFPSASENQLPLDRAIASQQIDEVRRLLEAGANPNARWGSSGDLLPLRQAVESAWHNGVSIDTTAALSLLLEHGADPNARWCPSGTRTPGPHCTSETGLTALHWAARFNYADAVGLLLEAGAAPGLRDWSGASALDYAYDEVVFELIASKQFPDLKTRDQLALDWVVRNGGSPYEPTPWQATPISRALKQSEGVFTYPAPPSPPPIPGSRRRAPSLRMTTWHTDSRRTAARLWSLLKAGADPNERVRMDGVDWTPLGMALASREFAGARLLLQHGADVNGRWCVPIDARPMVADRIVESGCTTDLGKTALMWSAGEGSDAAVELLLKFAADVRLTDWAGRSAADVARTDSIRRLLDVKATTVAPPQSR